MPPIAPRRRPFRPHSTYLFRLVLARSRCPSVSQASHFLAHLALLVPPEALCSPATSPKFSKRCPYGARLAPATGGAPATFSAATARPPQQSSRRAPGGDFNTRPAPLFLLPAGGRVTSQSHRIMPGKLERIVFYEASACIHFRQEEHQGQSIDQAAYNQGKGRYRQHLAVERGYRHD